MRNEVMTGQQVETVTEVPVDQVEHGDVVFIGDRRLVCEVVYSDGTWAHLTGSGSTLEVPAGQRVLVAC